MFCYFEPSDVSLIFRYSFIQELKHKCLETEPGSKEFWEKVRSIGRPLSYISDSEAAKEGGKSSFTESEAQKV